MESPDEQTPAIDISPHAPNAPRDGSTTDPSGHREELQIEVSKVEESADSSAEALAMAPGQARNASVGALSAPERTLSNSSSGRFLRTPSFSLKSVPLYGSTDPSDFSSSEKLISLHDAFSQFVARPSETTHEDMLSMKEGS